MIGSTISHYSIMSKLGEGGMGVVYKGRDTKLDRAVAIKVLPPHLASTGEAKSRFIQEAKSAAALNHPNIMNIYEIDEQNGELFFVMEYVDGKTLKQYLRDKAGAGVPVGQAFDWTIQIARGLKAAHDKGIIHRDIKSENIMLDSSGNCKIMDFGLAKLTSGAGLTRTGTSLGTLSYMSPEQASGTAADNRSDLWSLGVVLYELLTGELPFKAEHEAALLYLIVNEDPPVPSQLDRKIPAKVDILIRKLMMKDRAKRFQTADEVLRAIEETRADIEKTSANVGKKALAVLPFENIGAEKENEYFSDGLTEELIANLSRLKNVRVVSRNTTMSYKGTKKDIRTIGVELGVRYIVEGSVRKFQDNLRITADLIDVELDEQIWAETFKGTMADVFDIQEQVSKQIVDALMVKLSPNEEIVLTKRPTIVAEAFDCYLRARDFLYRRTKSSLQYAIQLFQRAIELDTRYAAAYAGLGEAYATLHYDYDTKEIWVDKAIESSLKALMYDSTVSEAYAALAWAYFSKKELTEAETAARKAIELGPNNFTGYWVLARIYHVLKRDAESVDLLKKTVELYPEFHTAYGELRMAYERMGEQEKYKEILARQLEIFPKYLALHPDDARSHIYYGIELAQVGRIDEARAEIIKALELSPGDPLMLYNAACCYSRIGEKRQAMRSLKESVMAGLEDYDWIKTDPDFDSLREEPEYLELMKGK
jgi:serine/threonine protein kinase/Flp pilus assembly protein TadD